MKKVLCFPTDRIVRRPEAPSRVQGEAGDKLFVKVTRCRRERETSYTIEVIEAPSNSRAPLHTRREITYGDALFCIGQWQKMAECNEWEWRLEDLTGGNFQQFQQPSGTRFLRYR